MTPEIRTEKIMHRLHVSRKALSQTLGISLSSVAMYFTGHHKIRKVVALAIQACYGISADYIMYGKLPVMVPTKGKAVSREAMEIAIMYDRLPEKLQASAKDNIDGLIRLSEDASTKNKNKRKGSSRRKAA